MSESRQPLEDKQAYKLLRSSGLVSDEKCIKCGYTPILDWFNYCPMCVYSFKKE